MGKQALKVSDKKINMLVNQLKNGKTWVERYDAALSLGVFGDMRALPHLSRSLNDPSNRVVDRSAEAIAMIAKKNPRHESVIKVIVPLIKSLERKFYSGLGGTPAYALEVIGISALKDLKKALSHKKLNIREAAVLVFARIAKKNPKNPIVKKSVPELAKAVTLKNGDVQQAISEALGKIGDPTALSALDYISKKGDHYRARSSAVRAILDIQKAEKARVKTEIKRKRKSVPRRVKRI
jgi:HEAT repeat protein